MESIVETKELCKDFNGNPAVDHVNMTVRRGDIYRLIGKNGAGKRHLCALSAGLQRPQAGS